MSTSPKGKSQRTPSPAGLDHSDSGEAERKYRRIGDRTDVEDGGASINLPDVEVAASAFPSDFGFRLGGDAEGYLQHVDAPTGDDVGRLPLGVPEPVEAEASDTLLSEEQQAGEDAVVADEEDEEAECELVPGPLPQLHLFPQEPLSEYSSVAAFIYSRIAPYCKDPNLEIELRLCTLCCSRGGRRHRTPILTPAVAAPSTTSVEVGVTPNDFQRLRAAVLSSAAKMRAVMARAADSNAESVLISQTEVKDLRVGQMRYTVSLDEPPRVLSCAAKKRLAVVDVLVPMMPYDIRVAASQELPVDHPPPLPYSGIRDVDHIRSKKRETVQAGSLLYDMTEVESSRGPPTCEVEIEGIFNDASVEVTPMWVNHLLTSALRLLNQLHHHP